MDSITLQICCDSQWHDALLVEVLQPDKGCDGAIRFTYCAAYAKNLLKRRQDFSAQCSLGYPIDLIKTYHCSHWLPKIKALLPSGPNERYWVKCKNLGNLPREKRRVALLKAGGISPPGNLRVKEALPNSHKKPRYYSKLSAVNRKLAWLLDAQQSGAQCSGFIGENSCNPQILLRQRDNRVWFDTYQNNFDCADPWYLVKYPAGKRTQIDCDLLVAEFYYYRLLDKLEINTIPVESMMLRKGDRFPSLWLPRIDMEWQGCEQGHWRALGLQPLASILGNDGFDCHFKILEKVVGVLSLYSVFDCRAFLVEWLKRDFFNFYFGFNDNPIAHSALLTGKNRIDLAPVFSCFPSCVTGVKRTVFWQGCELESSVDWLAICDRLQKMFPSYCKAEQLLWQLMCVEEKLTSVLQRSKTLGLPKNIAGHPALDIINLEQRLHVGGVCENC